MGDKSKESVGSRVRELREERGYSREGLAESADISVKFLYEIETDKKGFSAHTLMKLAEALGVSTDYIMMGHAKASHVLTSQSGNTKTDAAMESNRPNTLQEVEALLKLAYEWIRQDERS